MPDAHHDADHPDPDHLTRQGQQAAFDGITVRDYFAAAALQGIIASHSGECQLPDDDKAAKWSYAAADAMLKKRGQPPAA